MRNVPGMSPLRSIGSPLSRTTRARSGFVGLSRYSAALLFHGRWKVIADGVSMQVSEKGLPGRIVADGDYYLDAGATAILARDP